VGDNKVVIDLSLAFYSGWEGGASILNQSQGEVKQKQSKTKAISELLSTRKRKLLCEDEKFRASLEDI